MKGKGRGTFAQNVCRGDSTLTRLGTSRVHDTGDQRVKEATRVSLVLQ